MTPANYLASIPASTPAKTNCKSMEAALYVLSNGICNSKIKNIIKFINYHLIKIKSVSFYNAS